MDGRMELGRCGETLAAAYLRERRFDIVAQNFRCRAGEIDLIARDGDDIVFVEVRSRRGVRAGSALESVTNRKQARVARVARYWLQAQGLAESPARFDVVGVDFSLEPPQIDHVRGAFDAGA